MSAYVPGIIQEILGNGYENRKLTARVDRDHFGFEFDAGSLLADWRAVNQRVTDLESENASLRAIPFFSCPKCLRLSK